MSNTVSQFTCSQVPTRRLKAQAMVLKFNAQLSHALWGGQTYKMHGGKWSLVDTDPSRSVTVSFGTCKSRSPISVRKGAGIGIRPDYKLCTTMI
ncbi:hypothetical protein PGT21_024781 [Puccinia graminis f. sp. tritici]|uniref:Uncharacterized protein n=1 Tax=Puccinia graminis f. sp. tritici TaxID=56615 RepID=A0A5B0MS25_PUCGR|nr:hypothetical protein PGT21_024781 [Puccinia graminis f. sp. tritici]